MSESTPTTTATAQLAALREETLRKYQQRASRFGTSARTDVSDVALLGAKRYAVNTGFVTGFDTNSDEQQRKKLLRQKRFSEPAPGLSTTTAPTPADTPSESSTRVTAGSLIDDIHLRERRAQRFGAIPKENVPAGEVDMLEHRRDVSVGETLRRNVVHIFGVDALDNASIMRHFQEYGPSWCEWINDSSCNLCFEDAHTASRVLNAQIDLAEAADAPPDRMDDSEGAGASMGVAQEGVLEEIAKWKPYKPVIRHGKAYSIWIRVATDKDIRPARPNPSSRWSRTITAEARRMRTRNGRHGNGNAGGNSLMRERRRTDRRARSRSLDIHTDKSMAITKARSRAVTRADLDRALLS